VTNVQHSPLVSVHRTRKPCPVCGHRDNCAVSDDGTYCRRVTSSYPGRDGGYWHPNADAPAQASRPKPRAVEQARPAPVVDKHMRDAVCQALLRALPLFTPHRENLEARRLNQLAIARGRFKSTPTEEEAARLVKGIAEDCDLSGIPGFYRDRDGWNLVKVPSGFFVPVLDRDALIQGLQVRRDILRHPKDARYTWLSSKNYPHGSSSGAPVHIQNAERITATGKCIITEGALKAFIASQYLAPGEGGLIAVSGTSAFKENFGQQIKSVWPELHTATICFDADWTIKAEVKGALRRLVRSLKAASFESITVRTWEIETGKGIDDVLTVESSEVVEVAVA
jgi:hypothetical protein